MSRGWISESELRAVRTALSGAWRPARPEAEILRSLSWFPDERLVSWFLEGDGCAGGSVEALTLDAALSWRRQLLLRDLPSPLSSKDRFLPLIRCEAGFLIYDGAAKGVALRRTKAIERYPDALKDPLGLRALFEEDEAPGQYVDPWAGDEEEEEEEEPPERPVPLTLDKHLARLIQHHQWPTAQPPQELLTRLTPLCAVPELAEWFACVGEQTRLVFSDLRAFSFADALICRDELEGASSAALQAELHHQRWMPLLELPGRHAVLYWKGRGVRLHVFRAGAWQAAPNAVLP